jgi:hypothetical protein
MASVSGTTLLCLIAIAVVGTVTTLFNTVSVHWLPLYGGVLEQAALRHDSIYMLRERVLLHALATYFPLVAIAILCWKRAPLAALTAISATFAEKFVELIGQTVRVFVLNPAWREQLATSDVSAQWLIGGFADVWNAAFFVLWLCGAIAAFCLAFIMMRSGLTKRPIHETALAVLALAAGVLGLWMTASDYLGFPWSPHNTVGLYPIVMTGYRALVAWWLWKLLVERSG